MLELQLQHQSFSEYSGLISFRIDWFVFTKVTDLMITASEGIFWTFWTRHCGPDCLAWLLPQRPEWPEGENLVFTSFPGFPSPTLNTRSPGDWVE